MYPLSIIFYLQFAAHSIATVTPQQQLNLRNTVNYYGLF